MECSASMNGSPGLSKGGSLSPHPKGLGPLGSSISVWGSGSDHVLQGLSSILLRCQISLWPDNYTGSKFMYAQPPSHVSDLRGCTSSST